MRRSSVRKINFLFLFMWNLKIRLVTISVMKSKMKFVESVFKYRKLLMTNLLLPKKITEEVNKAKIASDEKIKQLSAEL